MTTKDLKVMKALYLKAKQEYYNAEKSSLSDSEFDILENQLRLAIPNWIALAATGTSVVNKKTKTELPRFLPSLNKQYPDAINAWVKRQNISNYLVMDKLDGTSLQLVYRAGVPVELYTRGDGTVGGNVSFLIPYLNIPKNITHTLETIFRCEAIFTNLKFNSNWQGSAEDGKFENARNAVNGLFNRKTPHKALSDVSIVILGIYDKPMMQSLNVAYKLGFETVNYTQHTKTPDFAALLTSAKLNSRYEMDGLVIASSNQNMIFANADRPAFMTAYKQNTDIEEAVISTVEEIIWQTSSHGRLIPKARITPVYIGGATVQYVTIHNAAWMLKRPLILPTKNNPNPTQLIGRNLLIGVGSKLKIVRSGDVIPKIVAVLTAGLLSNPTTPFELVGVHYKELTVSVNAELDRIQKFFSKLGIEFIAEKTIKSCFDSGLTSVLHYLKYWKEGTLINKFASSGLGVVISEKINNELTRVMGNGLTVMEFMVASGQFEAGLANRKLQYVIDYHKNNKDILRYFLNVRDTTELTKLLINVPMWSQKTIDLFIRGLVPFRKWLIAALPYVSIKDVVAKTKVITGKLSGQFITFTGYRNTEEENSLVLQGALIVNFSSKTTVLLYKDTGKLSTKLQKAKNNGIIVTTYSKFVNP